MRLDLQNVHLFRLLHRHAHRRHHLERRLVTEIRELVARLHLLVREDALLGRQADDGIVPRQLAHFVARRSPQDQLAVLDAARLRQLVLAGELRQRLADHLAVRRLLVAGFDANGDDVALALDAELHGLRAVEQLLAVALDVPDGGMEVAGLAALDVDGVPGFLNGLGRRRLGPQRPGDQQDDADPEECAFHHGSAAARIKGEACFTHLMTAPGENRRR